MEHSYWKRYDLVFKHFSFKKIYSKIRELAYRLGKPFDKKSKKGRNFKISPEEYASYIIFETVTGNKPFRDMELGSELYVNKHLDHSTFGKNFQRIPYDYLVKLLESTAKLLEDLLGTALVYIADSTGIVTTVYEDTEYQGKKIRRKKNYKAHSLVGYYPNKGVTYIKTGLGTDKHISDSKGACLMLDNYDLGWAYFSADSAYDFEQLHDKLDEKGFYPVIKPRKTKLSRATTTKKHREWFNQRIYKELRHVIETVFGGLENKKLLYSRHKRNDCIQKHSVIVQVRHNLQAFFRLKVDGMIKYYLYLIDKLY